MSELAAARAELARLNEREQELLEELGRVCATDQAQGNKALRSLQAAEAPTTHYPSSVYGIF